MTDFAKLAEAARALSSAPGGEKQGSGPDVLIIRFEAVTLCRAVEMALAPMQDHDVPYHIHGVSTPGKPAVIDVGIKLEQCRESRR